MAKPRNRNQQKAERSEISDLQLLVPLPQPNPAPLTPLFIERDREEFPPELISNLLGQRVHEDLALLHEYSQSDLDLTQLVPSVVENGDLDLARGRTSGRFKPALATAAKSTDDDDSVEYTVLVVPDDDVDDGDLTRIEPASPLTLPDLREACLVAAKRLPPAGILSACRTYLGALIAQRENDRASPARVSKQRNIYDHPDHPGHNSCVICALLHELLRAPHQTQLFGPPNGRRELQVLTEEYPGMYKMHMGYIGARPPIENLPAVHRRPRPKHRILNSPKKG